MDARNALSPRTPEELCQDSFGLVVKGVGGCDGVERDLAEELAEPRVAEAASSTFDRVRGQVIGVG